MANSALLMFYSFPQHGLLSNCLLRFLGGKTPVIGAHIHSRSLWASILPFLVRHTNLQERQVVGFTLRRTFSTQAQMQQSSAATLPDLSKLPMRFAMTLVKGLCYS